jgi:hypothetical protein
MSNPSLYQYSGDFARLASDLARDLKPLGDLAQVIYLGRFSDRQAKEMIIALLVKLQTIHIDGVEAVNRLDSYLAPQDQGLSQEIAPFVGDHGANVILSDEEDDGHDEAGVHPDEI